MKTPALTLLSFVSLALLIACGGPAGSPAGGDPPGGDVDAAGDDGSDIDTDACQGCLSNAACGGTQRCPSPGLGPVIDCCIDGARGSSSLGATCARGDDCAFGLCLERNDGAAFCSGACANDLECPQGWYCSETFYWCVPGDVGAPPSACEEVSLAQCYDNSNCYDDERCEDLGADDGEVLCCSAGARGSGEVGTFCDSELDCSFGRCIAGLCSEYCDYDFDPCPPDLMECNFLRYMCEPL